MELLDFISEIGKLKDIERAGWVARKVENPESVADHSYRVTVMAMLYAKKAGLDVEKCIKMALVHDMGEVYTKDIRSRPKEEDQDVTNMEKLRLEDEGTKKVLAKLPDEVRKEFTALWQEFAEQKTETAIFINDMDKVERSMQALEYAKSGRSKDDFSEFFISAHNIVKTDIGKSLLNELTKKFNEND